ncbi:MAG TPA: 16S rRNA (adenine(1518)-N(6)/adenine(1519)-N(6))-dimethyltransferase RsmA [Candidatus Binataceae bacterium]|jgi:16S rRNA (adenine1518-N6/adenine1519-N6)-dimethyltransferase|nr:16S rRNA (adenine(1518)-N(6)/adenine(1519)-N(6))-dimethyltransferase RsmA [Candidatus Binataceae bacterium]
MGTPRLIRARRANTEAAKAGRTSPLAVAAQLEAAGVRPRKSRGQNFLIQPAIADRIVAAAAIEPGEEVVEVGPGLGILSDKILRAGVRRLWLVELDPRLAELLQSAFAGHPAVRVVCRDFLEVELAAMVEQPPVKVIGNLPFNAAGAILRRLDEMRGAIGRMVLMFQREVAERIRAHEGERAYSALSVFTALYWETRDHFRVSAGNFRPAPRVDAEVIVFTPHARAPFAPADEAALLGTIRAAFSAPRKTIRNALAGALDAPPEAVIIALADAAIDSVARPATLSVADFERLAHALERAGAITSKPGMRERRDA